MTNFGNMSNGPCAVLSIILCGLLSNAVASRLQMNFDPHDLQFQVGDHCQFVISLSFVPNGTVHADLVKDKGGIVRLSADNVTFAETVNQTFAVDAHGTKPGSLVVWANASAAVDCDTTQAFVRIKVKALTYLDVVSDVIGWIYFTAWSISFYPQIYLNFKRRSVVGLHLDFLALNTMGFFCYSLFNCGLFFNKEIQNEYFVLHPRGVNPVQLNDVVFALHAMFACVVTGIQAFFFERGEQRVSRICLCLVGAAIIFIGASLVLSLKDVITWLTYLYYFSYVKLAITIVKYMPQVYFNFKRKSTKGWSIGNILLDFTGGFLSILQMFIIAYNYDDWTSLFGDPTKFGLGLFSILFDILFITQHYVLYRHAASCSTSPYKIMSSSSSSEDGTGGEHYTSYQEGPTKNHNVVN